MKKLILFLFLFLAGLSQTNATQYGNLTIDGSHYEYNSLSGDLPDNITSAICAIGECLFISGNEQYYVWSSGDYVSSYFGGDILHTYSNPYSGDSYFGWLGGMWYYQTTSYTSYFNFTASPTWELVENNPSFYVDGVFYSSTPPGECTTIQQEVAEPYYPHIPAFSDFTSSDNFYISAYSYGTGFLFLTSSGFTLEEVDNINGYEFWSTDALNFDFKNFLNAGARGSIDFTLPDIHQVFSMTYGGEQFVLGFYRDGELVADKIIGYSDYDNLSYTIPDGFDSIRIIPDIKRSLIPLSDSPFFLGNITFGKLEYSLHDAEVCVLEDGSITVDGEPTDYDSVEDVPSSVIPGKPVNEHDMQKVVDAFSASGQILKSKGEFTPFVFNDLSDKCPVTTDWNISFGISPGDIPVIGYMYNSFSCYVGIIFYILDGRFLLADYDQERLSEDPTFGDVIATVFLILFLFILLYLLKRF